MGVTKTDFVRGLQCPKMLWLDSHKPLEKIIPEAVQKRLKFLCSTTDGFAVAQYDLETRGPGDFFGSRQHGLPTLQIADLMNDTRTLHAAQSEALAMLAEDPLLQAPEHALLAAQVQQMFDKAGPMN